MRTSVASLSKKLISTFFAATLALGLVPAAAFAVDEDSLTPIPEGSEGADPIATSAEEEGRDVLALPSDAFSSADGDGAASTSEDVSDENAERGQGDSAISDSSQDDVAAGDVSDDAAVPAAGVINQTMPLEVVAQQESTRSYFLAQTLESTKTVPIVSANLPLDTSVNQGPQAGADGGEGSSEDEGGDGSDESDLDASDGAAAAPGVSSESTVVGSFIYRGITYAVEPGGESVAVVAVDYAKLPQEFVDAQTIVLPSMVTSDGLDFYTVSRIADYAFAGINKSGAAAVREGQDADTSSSMQAQAEAYAYENDAVANSSEDFGTIDDVTVELSGSDDTTADAVAESFEGDSTTNDAVDDAMVSITTVAIPASIVKMDDDAFTGAGGMLQYVIVSEGNPNYSMYDGCLYDADQTNLLLIPEGRLGAVRIAPSVMEIDPEVFSHCLSVDVLIADLDSAAYQLLADYGEECKNADGKPLRILTSDSEEAEAYDTADLTSAAELMDAEVEVGAQSALAFSNSSAVTTERASQSALVRSEYGNYEIVAPDAGLLESGGPSSIRFIDYGAWQRYYSRAAFSVADSKETQWQEVNRADYDTSALGTTIQVTGTQNTWGTGLSTLRTFIECDTRYGLALWNNCMNAQQGGSRWHFMRSGGTSWETSTSVRWGILYDDPNNRSSNKWFIGQNDASRFRLTASKGGAGAWMYLGYGTTTAIGFHVNAAEGETWSDGYYGDRIFDKGSSGNYALNISTALNGVVPQKENHIFVGWSTLRGGGRADDGTFIPKESTEYATSMPTTLFAVFEPGYWIGFDAVQGQGAEESYLAMNEIHPLKSQVAIPTRDNYAFEGYYELREGGSRNFWYDEHGNLVEPVDGNSYGGYPLTHDETLYAQWSRDIILDAQGGSPEQKLHMIWDEPLPQKSIASGACDPESGPVEHETVDIVVPVRDGYEFNGYWSTPCDESNPGKDLYYEVKDGAVVPIEGKTWDIGQDRLYAHWKYKIYLSTNSVDSDGNVVVAADRGTIDASSLPDGMLRCDDNGTPDDATDDRYYIEAIDGAPIQLPQVIGRTGYVDSGAGTDGATAVNARSWGVKAGSYGWASGLIPLDDDGFTVADPAELELDFSNIDDVRAYDGKAYFASLATVLFPKPDAVTCSINLYLNWENRAKTYEVALISAYDGFSVSNLPSAKIAAIYDAPLLMEQNGASIVYADFLHDATEVSVIAPEKIVGEGATRHHEYIFKGFRTEPNEIDGAAGVELIGAQVVGTGADIVAKATAVAAPFRIDMDSPELFAAWGRVKSTLTLDLNGGSLAGLSGDVLTVMNGDEEFTFTAEASTPSLPAAYANVPVRTGYVFKGYYTEASGAGAAFARYAEDGTNVAYYTASGASVVPADRDWAFYTNITLYAHWEYVIDFRLDHAVDCASNPDGTHTALTLMNAPLTEGVTDRYGNSYPVGGPEVDVAASSLKVTALFGVPVMVPVAQLRNGYNDTWTWQVRQGDAVSGAARSTVSGNAQDAYFTSKEGEDGALVPAAPFADIVPNANTHVVTAFVDWTDQEKTYWVKIVPDRTDEGSLGTQITGASPEAFKVRFGEVFPLLAGDNVLSVLPADTDTDRNLVFTGVYDTAAAIGGATGVRYIGVNGSATTPDAVFAPKARDDGYNIDDALVKSTGETSVPSGTHPIPVYARWAYPSCAVTFSMNTGNIAGAGSVDEAFELQTNDALPRLKDLPESVDQAKRDALAQQPIKQTVGNVSSSSDYVFDGYWSDPSAGVQYYTADLEPVAGVTWDFAGATTLYAHWTYKVRLNLNGSVPEGLKSAFVDGLVVSSLGGGSGEPQPQPVVTVGAPPAVYELTVVWGADATVPARAVDILRQRFELPYQDDSAVQVGCDYRFDGWRAAADDTDALFAEGSDVMLGGTAKDTLQPSFGAVELYAGWARDPYRVTLDYKGDDASLADAAFAVLDEGGHAFGRTELTGVLFDEPIHTLGATLPAPHRLGYEFLGYYDQPGGQGVCYLTPTVDGAMTATAELWGSHAGQAEVKLYAHYEQLTYRISFSVRPPEGETKNAVSPQSIRDIEGVDYYRPLYDNSSTGLVLSCEGYVFAGWNVAPDGTGRTLFDGSGNGQGIFAEERDVTVYPLWEPMTKTVVWDFNIPPTAAAQPVQTSTEMYNRVSSSMPVPACTGYTFLGWFRDATASIKQWESGTPFRPTGTDLAASELTYYAHWAAVPYNVTLLPGEHGSYESMRLTSKYVEPDGEVGYKYVYPYTVADRNWTLVEPDPLPGWDFIGWERIERDEQGSGWVVVDPQAKFYVNADDFTAANSLTFRARWSATMATVRLDLGDCDDPGALGDFPAVFSYGIGSPVQLPRDLDWPGHTFQGWQLVEESGSPIASPGEPSKDVTVVAAENENPRSRVYRAVWVQDAYTIEFAMSEVNATAIAEPITGLGRTDEFTFPVPTYRDTFPLNGDMQGEVAENVMAYIFRHYMVSEGRGTYLSGDICTIEQLLQAHPDIRDTEGNVPRDGSTIRLYGAWTTGYHVDVPLIATVSFDPDHVETSLKSGEAKMRIVRSTQTQPVEVVGLLCDPIAYNSSSEPGTEGTFDSSIDVLDGTYLTLTARKMSDDTPSASEEHPIEFNLGQLVRSAGDGVTVQGRTMTAEDETGAGERTVPLSELGFAFGGSSDADRTLDLTFGLRFDDAIDPTALLFLNSAPFKDSGARAPIAKVHYTLAMPSA